MRAGLESRERHEQDRQDARPWRVKVREYARHLPRLEAEAWEDFRTCGCTLCGWPSQSKKLRAEDKRAILQGLLDYYDEE